MLLDSRPEKYSQASPKDLSSLRWKKCSKRKKKNKSNLRKNNERWNLNRNNLKEEKQKRKNVLKEQET